MDCGHLEFTAWTFVLLYMGNNLWLSNEKEREIFLASFISFFFFNLTYFCLHHVCSALVFLAVHDSTFLCLKTFLQAFRAGGVFPFPERRSVCGQEQLSLCLAVMTTPQVPKQQTPFSLSQTSVMTDKPMKCSKQWKWAQQFKWTVLPSFAYRSQCKAGHVVPCLCRGSQRVCSSHWPKPDQPVVPWTNTVGETRPDLCKPTYYKSKMNVWQLNHVIQVHWGQLFQLLSPDSGCEAEWCGQLPFQVWDRPATGEMDLPQHHHAWSNR